MEEKFAEPSVAPAISGGTLSEPLALEVSEHALPAGGSPALAENLPIVAIAASAGGLEATSRLLDALPQHCDMAFILVQHLDPTHESLLVELLAEHTAMTVVEAVDGCPLAADHLYVIPPGRYLSIHAGALRLSAPQARHGARLPIDFLFRSLAQDCGEQSACLVLSGTGADGSQGLAALKASGGTIIAQDPQEAEYDGMPRSAIATGLVDHILTLAAMPQALRDFAKRIPAADKPLVSNDLPPQTAGLAEIIALLKDRTAHDFRQYKPGTIDRRIERRIGLLGIQSGDLTSYLALLHHDSAERDLLAKDLLINVTSFFRDAKVFETLESTTFPEIIRNMPAHQALRIWVAGCSTGQEAYSLAMVCQDALTEAKSTIKLQIFASDVDPDAVAIAREGYYPAEFAETIAADRLARFLVKEDLGYRICATLRGLVVFTVQDVLSDPPFSRLDLVSCRNLLIYLNPEAQSKVISLFHFALREGGILLLGTSETSGNAEGQFEVLSKTDRLYRRIAHSQTGVIDFPFSVEQTPPHLAERQAASFPARHLSLADITTRALLAGHAPPAVLINRQRHCLYLFGPTERFLRVASGYATLDILAMATPAVRTKLRLAIDKAGKAEPRVDGGTASFTEDGETIWFRIEVQWLEMEREELLLVCFVEQAGFNAPSGTEHVPADGAAGYVARIAELELELEATQIELQAAFRNQDTANQEQKAINEEALSVNEEFQSTNEELLTSKEELQSLNEELTALNGQLQETLERQRLTSDDLQNVLYSTNVATLFLDAEFKIRFFTPAIKALFSVIPSDVGRPLADFRSKVSDAELLSDAQHAMANEVPVERELSGPNDAWFVRRIFPYRAHDQLVAGGRVEGVVITFADVTELRGVAKALEAAKLEAERANIAKSRFLAAASHDLRQPMQSLTLLQALLAHSVEGEKAQKLIARFDKTLGAMSGMLIALLDINQIETGSVEAKPVAFRVSDVLNRLRDEFTYMAEAKSLTLHIVASSAIVDSDPHLLEQIIRNLLGNALKYTKRGKILLGCRHRGGVLRIEVWDTGIGIAPEELHAIFDEFHQIGNRARERSQGLGLGLSIVQRIGNLLGHAIGVRSDLGKGSVFTIDVPRASARATAPFLPAMTRVGADIGHHCCKIVVVDDDPDVLELLEQLLVANGHIVRTAIDAASALNLVAGGAMWPEVLLTDYNLPGEMNGLQLLAALRGTTHQDLPGIILTGDISREALVRIAAQNCIHLSKPVDPGELVTAIEGLVSTDLPYVSAGLPAITRPRGSVTYVVDDDPDVRATISEVLEGDGRLVHSYESAEAFLDAYNPAVEGCLLVDANLPGMSGVALLEALRARRDHIPVILITGSSDVGLAVAAMQNGACDFIEKPVSRAELLATIARALAQSRSIREIDVAQKNAANHVADLTSRQREIMAMVLAGHPSKNIAADLGISQRTVENHRAAIMQKMEAKSLPELARAAQAATAHGEN